MGDSHWDLHWRKEEVCKQANQVWPCQGLLGAKLSATDQSNRRHHHHTTYLSCFTLTQATDIGHKFYTPKCANWCQK